MTINMYGLTRTSVGSLSCGSRFVTFVVGLAQFGEKKHFLFQIGVLAELSICLSLPFQTPKRTLEWKEIGIHWGHVVSSVGRNDTRKNGNRSRNLTLA
jgi:hypothetical protein